MTLAVQTNAGPVLVEEIEAAAGQAALEEDAVVVVDSVVDLGVLGEVGQDAAVADAGLDLGVERARAGPRGRPAPAGRARRRWAALMAHRLVVVGPQDVEERAVGDLVGLVQDEERRVVRQAELVRGPP